MRRLILGTAGHIDHGKTALVKHLTGADTDRLKEEKERGITVDLGFAELVTHDGTSFGVVDVPGHEGFIKNMLAGASGMDLVLMVVAADEGVMPQTREHLAILRLLGVPRLLVALTKADLVEEDWLDLVRDDVRELLEATPYREAPILPVSIVSGEGIGRLLEVLTQFGQGRWEREGGDLARLPIDRVFTVRGTGTVVTGTLWSGTLRLDDKVRILPGDLDGRVRSLQFHGREVREAPPGGRVAVAIAGPDIHHQRLSRGQTLVSGPGWRDSRMLTCFVSVLPDTGWELGQGQRARLHLGTAEVLARCALLQGDRLFGGEEGWVQLRLEEPLLARKGDHFVLRSYSPVTTIGGGRVAEVVPPKRKSVSLEKKRLLADLLSPSPTMSLSSLLELLGWEGLARDEVPHRLGLSPDAAAAATEEVCQAGKGVFAQDRYFAGSVWEEARLLVMASLEEFHSAQPLQAGMPLQELRQVLPPRAGPGFSEGVILELTERGEVALEKGVARVSGFRASLTPEQTATRERILEVLTKSGLAPPTREELAAELGQESGELESILRHMERRGDVLGLEGGLFFLRSAVEEAGAAVVRKLGGKAGLGPADFREVLGLTRKYLLPLLRFMDTVGVTTRVGEDRRVAESLPRDWGASSPPPSG